MGETNVISHRVLKINATMRGGFEKWVNRRARRKNMALRVMYPCEGLEQAMFELQRIANLQFL